MSSVRALSLSLSSQFVQRYRIVHIVGSIGALFVTPYKILLSELVQSNRKIINNGNMKIENTVSRTIEISLRIFGIWPDTTYILLRRLFWTVMLVIEQTFQYRYIIMRFHLIEFFEMIGVLSTTMPFTMFLIKLLIFWYKQR